MTQKHVIVVGAGVIGASIAYHLAKAGAKVTVLERAAPASGASNKSFGWINANFAETPAYYNLRRAGIEYTQELVPEIGADNAVQWHGSLWWEDEGQSLLDLKAQQDEIGYPTKVLNRAEFAALEPHVENPPESCIKSMIDGAGDPVQLTHDLLEKSATLGARVLQGCSVSDFCKSGDVISGVKTNLGDMVADHVVIATGVDAEALLARVDVNLPMDNQHGIIVHTAPVAQTVEHIIMSPDIHFRQNSDGRILMGEIFSGGQLNAAEGQTAEDFAVVMMERLRERLPHLSDLSIEKIMVGQRPVPMDGLPVMGMPNACKGLYIASMHSGVTLAALMGKLAAEEIVSGVRSGLLAEFGPDRFSP
jgi:glycine/D-amino acid oxidase-like deaminating enzyme